MGVRSAASRTPARRAPRAPGAGVPQLVECEHCHEPKLPHHACPNCGWYQGRQAIELKQSTTDTAS